MNQSRPTSELSTPPTNGSPETRSLDLPLLDGAGHLPSTLRSDGSRRWLYPRLAAGGWWKRRRWLAYFLIVFFVALPHLRIHGKPVILLDIGARQFVIGGHTFLPSDTLLLALLMVGVFVAIGLATAFAGRVWCGWGCPQTIYMEFLFRPIDRLFQGTAGKGGRPKRLLGGAMILLRFLVYLVLCMMLAHTFLAYFVGTERLAMWIRSSPLQQPTAFGVMAATTGLMLFDFMYFREQMCLIACPYGRLQSVMLDRQSLIVAYDPGRGEPRKKGRHQPGDGDGDCFDCNQCVVVCPTGIDIRNGLQLECVNCTQCIDACDNVMDRVRKPRGLIRYSSQDALAGKKIGLFRWRTIAYPTLLAVMAIGFLVVLSTKYAFDAKIMRSRGNPFNPVAGGNLTNHFSLRLVNRTEDPRTYHLTIAEPAEASIQAEFGGQIHLEINGNSLFPVVVQVPASRLIPSGRCKGRLRITDDIGNERFVTMTLLGPRP